MIGYNLKKIKLIYYKKYECSTWSGQDVPVILKNLYRLNDFNDSYSFCR